MAGCCFTAALLLLYRCFTAAELLLYRCFPVALHPTHLRAYSNTEKMLHGRMRRAVHSNPFLQ
jgi:hypothetical protein